MENIYNFIKPELLILIPVLYFVGKALKKSKDVSDSRIPIILGLAGVILALIYVLATSAITTWQDGLMGAFVGITQGVLSAGCSVYTNQLIKQTQKDK